MSLKRSSFAVLAGIIAGGFVTVAVEMIGHGLFPAPGGVDVTDATELAAVMDEVPLGALLAVLLAWFLGVLVGTLVALRWGPPATAWPSLLVAAVLLSGAAWNLVTLHHPTWFVVASAILLPVAALIGVRVGLRAQPDAAQARSSSYSDRSSIVPSERSSR